MRKCLLVFVLATMSCSQFQRFQVGYKNENVLPRSDKLVEIDPGVRSVIEKFWRASLTKNGELLGDITGPVPANYYKMAVECSKSPVGGVDSAKKGLERSNILDLSNEISEKRFDSYSIKLAQQSSDHAAVRIHWGTDEMHSRFQVFLFSHSGSGWRLFSITSAEFLRFDNAFFAVPNCETESPMLKPFTMSARELSPADQRRYNSGNLDNSN